MRVDKCVMVFAIALSSPALAGSLVLHVAASGSRTAECSATNPCSITRAQALARSRAAVDDVIVELAGGVYSLREPIVFTPADSGRPGHPTIWRSVPGARAILSGGTQISGWKQVAEINGHKMFRADAPALVTGRTLYVSGVRATKGRTPNLIDEAHVDATGFLTNGLDLSKFLNPEAIESVEQRNEFQTRRCKLRNVTRFHAEAAPCFENRVLGRGYSGYFENAYELTRDPGDWYLDRTGAVSARLGAKEEPAVFYLPRDAEDLSTAEAVIGGGPGTLMSFEGTLYSPVHDMEIRDIGFAYTSWDRVENNTLGYDAVQTGIHRVGLDAGFFEPAFSGFGSDGPIDTVIHADYPTGAIELNYAHNIKLIGNRLQHLGTWGIVAVHGIQNLDIAHNILSDLSGGGVSLGGIELEDHHPCGDDPASGPCSSPTLTGDNRISDNLIEHVGREYFDSVGIAGYNFVRTVIEHNTLLDLPYTGIAFGLGFGHTDARPGGGIGQLRIGDPGRHFYARQPAFGANLIQFNLIDNYQQLLRDGGGIYTNGYMADTRVENNVMRWSNGVTRTGIVGWIAGPRGLFADEGTQGVRYNGNVVIGATETININSHAPAIPKHNRITETYGTSSMVKGFDALTSGPNELLESPILIGPKNRARVDAIVAAAGVRRE